MMLTHSMSVGKLAIVLLSELDYADPAPLPLREPPPSRKTSAHYVRRASRNRYSGPLLRAIRATGQDRECARRRSRMIQAVA